MKNQETEHEQIKIYPYKSKLDYYIEVDKGLEDIIMKLYDYNLFTSLSCINNHGKIWIAFKRLYICQEFMEFILRHNISINGIEFKRETLWTYLIENSKFNIVFGEDGILDDNDFKPNGKLDAISSIRFPKEDLNLFKRLFFEVFK